jgi:hypothetical protein
MAHCFHINGKEDCTQQKSHPVEIINTALLADYALENKSAAPQHGYEQQRQVGFEAHPPIVLVPRGSQDVEGAHMALFRASLIINLDNFCHGI